MTDLRLEIEQALFHYFVEVRHWPHPEPTYTVENVKDFVEWWSQQRNLLQVLEAIERLVADDFCEELDCERAFRPERFSEREKMMHDKLSAIYKLAHSFNPTHCCYDVHGKWRKLLDQSCDPNAQAGEPQCQ